MSFKHLQAATSVMLLAAVLSSCSEKEGVALFEGNYSFKTSGTLEVEKKQDSETSTLSLSLTPESGQMNIVKDSGDEAIITMNIIGGDALVLSAETSTDSKMLTLKPTSRQIKVTKGLSSVTFDCTVSGYAKKYDDMLIFTLTYAGQGSTSLYDYTITGSDVKCVAKVNK